MHDPVNHTDMLALSINADDLLAALRERNPLVESWLDRETGDIYQISALFGDDEVEDDPAFAHAMQHTPHRFLRLPVVPASLSFQAMLAFADTVEDQALRERLGAALKRQRAFFHFQDCLASVPAQHARWQQSIRHQMLNWAEQWLRAGGIVARLQIQ